jgi:hypothetical protein
MSQKFREWLPVWTPYVGFALTIYVAYQSAFTPAILAWLNGVKAWRFAFWIALICWGVYFIYRCCVWIEKKIGTVADSLSDLYTQFGGMCRDHHAHLDELSKRVEERLKLERENRTLAESNLQTIFSTMREDFQSRLAKLEMRAVAAESATPESAK